MFNFSIKLHNFLKTVEELGRSHLMDEDFHQGQIFDDETCTMDESQELKLHHG
jgi:hypothetical protein